MHRHARARLAAALVISSLLAACGLGAASLAERLALDPLTVERSGRPNDALVCPTGQCRATADRQAPVLALPAADQRRLWEEGVQSSPRARLLQHSGDPLLLHAEQRTALLRFVDTSAVRILPLSDHSSTFAAYSRSELGYYDLGVNAARLDDWIARVVAAAGG